uniref:Uncharacterized protein n=1 Tax=Octopus bimaculoides TaxID=37653 RepID=A0A0L8HGI0_OCTBM
MYVYVFVFQYPQLSGSTTYLDKNRTVICAGVEVIEDKPFIMSCQKISMLPKHHGSTKPTGTGFCSTK